MVFVLLSVALMTLDHRQHHLGTLRGALSVLVYPLQFTVNLPGMSGEWLSEAFSTRRKLQEENARLRTQALVLKANLQKFAALQAENVRLRELLDSSFQVGERVLIAEIMAVDLDPYRHEVVLNKGEGYGIYPGQPVVDADGIMGQVVQTGPLTSNAMLITDPNHAIPVQVNRNGLRSIALGIGSLTTLSLPHVPNNADIRVGDLLVTSGLGGRFPAGYPVAEVVGIVRDPGHAFAHIEARPMANLDRSREVLLIWLATQADRQAAVQPAAETADSTAEPESPEPETGDEQAPNP